MASFSEILKYLRNRAGYTQQELADKIGVSKQVICMYEKGRRRPSYEVEEAIADVFNVSLDVLRGIDEEIKDADTARIVRQIQKRPELKDLVIHLCKMDDETIGKITMIVNMVEK